MKAFFPIWAEAKLLGLDDEIAIGGGKARFLS